MRRATCTPAAARWWGRTGNCCRRARSSVPACPREPVAPVVTTAPGQPDATVQAAIRSSGGTGATDEVHQLSEHRRVVGSPASSSGGRSRANASSAAGSVGRSLQVVPAQTRVTVDAGPTALRVTWARDMSPSRTDEPSNRSARVQLSDARRRPRRPRSRCGCASRSPRGRTVLTVATGAGGDRRRLAGGVLVQVVHGCAERATTSATPAVSRTVPAALRRTVRRRRAPPITCDVSTSIRGRTASTCSRRARAKSSSTLMRSSPSTRPRAPPAAGRAPGTPWTSRCRATPRGRPRPPARTGPPGGAARRCAAAEG